MQAQLRRTEADTRWTRKKKRRAEPDTRRKHNKLKRAEADTKRTCTKHGRNRGGHDADPKKVRRTEANKRRTRKHTEADAEVAQGHTAEEWSM